MARKMRVVLHRLQTIRNAEQVMQHVDLKFLKPVAQLEAERLGAFDELGEIANAIDLAALAVIGMAKELGGEEGNLLANYLRDQAEGIRNASKQLLTAPTAPPCGQSNWRGRD
jgi:hypothetical protein